MESGLREAVGNQAFAQRRTPGCRAAEPDATCGLQAGFYFLGAERAVLVGLATVQLDAGGLAEWLKLARKITGFTTRGAVEKITVRLLCLVCSGQFAEVSTPRGPVALLVRRGGRGRG